MEHSKAARRDTECAHLITGVLLAQIKKGATVFLSQTGVKKHSEVIETLETSPRLLLFIPL